MSLVSIIIPVFNSERFLAKTIESALKQTWPIKEVIVIDDGSTDASLSIAHSFASKDIHIVSQKNSGASVARNRGLALAKGQWIQFLDADDILHEDKLSTQIASLQSAEDIAVCKTVHFVTDISDGTIDDDRFFQDYLDDPLRFLIRLYGGFDYTSGMIQPNAFLIPKFLIDKAGRWNESLSLDDDGEYFCRVLLCARHIVYHPRPMNFYRKYQSNSSLSGTKTRKAYHSQFQSILLKHQHLLSHHPDDNLVPHIHTATYKALRLLMHHVYPEHMDIYRDAENVAKSLIKHSSRGKEVYGGRFANFVGNQINWKLLKRLQILKARISSDN